MIANRFQFNRIASAKKSRAFDADELFELNPRLHNTKVPTFKVSHPSADRDRQRECRKLRLTQGREYVAPTKIEPRVSDITATFLGMAAPPRIMLWTNTAFVA